MNYRREIDGLRALAVLPVILFHAGFQAVGGGFVGVDVFFVISGYLITALILAELEQGTFSLVAFYERRARRILPALFLVMGACLPFAWLWLLPDDMTRFSHSLVAVSAFASNLLFWRTTGYFDTSAERQPLLHTWSLAVEEQYYVLFPLCLLLTWRLGRRWMAPLLGVAFAVSLATARWSAVAAPVAAFFLLPTRGFELLIGAFVAVYFSRYPRLSMPPRVVESGGVAGMALILYAIVAFDRHTPWPSLYALVPTVGAALVLVCATDTTVVGRILGRREFVGVGLISYSAYLWHQPLLAFAQHSGVVGSGAEWRGGLTILSIGLAYVSWKYVETPFRDTRRFSRRHIFLFSALGSVVFVAIGVAGHLTHGFEGLSASSRWEIVATRRRAIMEYRSYAYKDVYRDGVCSLTDEQSSKDFSAACAAAGSAESLLIWGDSHAAALSFGLRHVVPNVAQYTSSGCPPIVDAESDWRPHCKEVNDFVVRAIAAAAPSRVWLHAYWGLERYRQQEPVRNIHRTIERIRRASPSSDITLIGPVPLWEPDLPAVLLSRGVSLDGEYYLPTPTLSALRAVDRALSAEAANAGVTFMSALDVLCREDTCLATTNHLGTVMPTAWDYAHLTQGGSVVLATRLMRRQ